MGVAFGVFTPKWVWSVSFAWLSVTVKMGATIVVKIGWDNLFGELLTAVDPDLHSEVVRKVSISKNKKFIDPVHEVDVPAPLTVCSIFGYKFA